MLICNWPAQHLWCLITTNLPFANTPADTIWSLLMCQPILQRFSKVDPGRKILEMHTVLNTIVCLISHTSYCQHTQLLVVFFSFGQFSLLPWPLKLAFLFLYCPLSSEMTQWLRSQPVYPSYLQHVVSKTWKKWTTISRGRRKENPCLLCLQSKCEPRGVPGVSWPPLFAFGEYRGCSGVCLLPAKCSSLSSANHTDLLCSTHSLWGVLIPSMCQSHFLCSLCNDIYGLCVL